MKANSEHKKIVAEIAKEVYKDGAKETVQSSGKLISLLPRVIHAALCNVEKWILNKEYSIKETQKMLEYKLKNIDPSKISEPEAYVAVPTINALSYSFASDDLIDLYANLLASSMIDDEKWKVHPSFVEIIKQLSPDEAKLLKYLADYKGENEFPLINLVMKRDNDNYTSESYIKISNFSGIGFGVCDCPENISSYIDNLIRLQLIEIKDMSRVSDYDYSIECNHDLIKTYINNNPLKPGFTWEFDEFMFMITNFGKLFINVCVHNPILDKKE